MSAFWAPRRFARGRRRRWVLIALIAAAIALPALAKQSDTTAGGNAEPAAGCRLRSPGTTIKAASAGPSTADGFLGLAMAAAVVGLGTAWVLANHTPLATRPPTGPARDRRAPAPPGWVEPGPARRVVLGHAYNQALAWARQRTTAELVDFVRSDPTPEQVPAWAAAHHVLVHERGAVPLPGRRGLFR